MLERVDALQIGYSIALQDEKKSVCGKLIGIDRKYTPTVQNVLHLLCHRIAVTIDDLSQAVHINEETTSGTSLAVSFVYLFRKSTDIAILYDTST